MLIAIGLKDATMLSVLSSRTHVVLSLGVGGTLEDRPRYNKSLCFYPVPFPDFADAPRARLRTLGQDLDSHRKRQQAAHPKLTLTQMYIVPEKLRAGEPIEGKEREVYDKGLVGILKDLADQIARRFIRARTTSVQPLMASLAALGQVEQVEEGRYAALTWE